MANKNIPNRQIIKKVKGRTFHLPLPLETTLNKLPNPEDPLNVNHELYILVRTCPTKNKIMWQYLVYINNIYKALEYLKLNNIHFANIILPQKSAHLLVNLNQDLNHAIEVTERRKKVFTRNIPYIL